MSWSASLGENVPHSGFSWPKQVIGHQREADHEHDQQCQRHRIAHAATVGVTQVISAMSHMASRPHQVVGHEGGGDHHDDQKGRRLAHDAAARRRSVGANRRAIWRVWPPAPISMRAMAHPSTFAGRFFVIRFARYKGRLRRPCQPDEMPHASWRINSSRVKNQPFGLCYQKIGR